MNIRFVGLAALTTLVLLTACAPIPLRRRAKPEPARHVTAAPKETAELSDREYLMRKATIGSRPERVEALDVIERSNDTTMVPFLLERLDKEDDRFIQIRIMHALAATGDVRAVPRLRSFARWDATRVGIEAVSALYELGDDYFVPRVIYMLRPNEETPEVPGIAFRALRRMTGQDLPPNTRAWLNYYRAHRIAPYQVRPWYWPFRPPLPATVEGTTKIAPHAKGKLPLPDKDVRVRHTNVIWTDWWKPEGP